ncbi:MAG: hypothetical protein AAF927_24605 [Bacteroidota bacterium]
MLSKFLYLSLACFTLPMIAGDGIKDNSGEMDLQIQFDSVFNGGAANLTFYNGTIRLSEIEFEGENANGEEVEYELAQLTTIDLTTGLASPALDPIVIPSGDYEGLALELKGATKGSVISLEGYFTDRDQSIVPLQVNIKESLNLAIDHQKYSVASSPSLSASFLIDPSHWFANISQQDLLQADRDANGVVHIDPNRNTKLYHKITADLPQGIKRTWAD